MYHIAQPLTVGMSATAAPPQPAATNIVWTAVATGGTPPYFYRWGVFDGAKWSVTTEWQQAATFTWSPPVAGDYVVHVWTRGVLDQSVEATTSTPFAITKRVYPQSGMPLTGARRSVTGGTWQVTAEYPGGRCEAPATEGPVTACWCR